MDPSLLAYYSQRRHGTIPEKPHEEWGPPESKTRKRHLEIIDEREIDNEIVQFRAVDWNSPSKEVNGGEPLSPKGGPIVSPDDVQPWVGQVDQAPIAVLVEGVAKGRLLKGVKGGIGRRKEMEALRRRLEELRKADAEKEGVNGGKGSGRRG